MGQRHYRIFAGCSASILLLPLSIHLCGPLIALALTPAIVAICEANKERHAMVAAWLTGTFASFLVQHTLWVASFTGTGLLAGYQGLTWIPVFFGVRTLWRRWHIPLTLTWPIAWCAGEAIRTWGPFGTLFGTLAVPKTTTIWMLQIADLGGATVTALPLAMLQGWFADCILSLKYGGGFGRSIKTGFKSVYLRSATIMIAVTWSFVFVYGHWRLEQIEANMKSGPNVATIATDVLALPNGEPSYDPKLLLTKLQTLSKDSIQSDPKPELVIWPEGMLGRSIPNRAFIEAEYDPRMASSLVPNQGSSADKDLLNSRWEQRRRQAASEEGSFRDWVDQMGVPILLGMDAWIPAPPGIQDPFTLSNAAVRFTPNEGQSESIQAKCRLYPLGEYAPWTGTPVEGPMTALLGPPRNDYQPGVTRHRYTLGQHGPSYAVALCSELKFDHLRGRQNPQPERDKPYDFLINIANEGLFHRNGMPEIFAFCATLRAIENRVTVVRSSNAGISGFWDPIGRPYGTVTNQLGQVRSGQGAPEIPLIQSLIRFRQEQEEKFSENCELREELSKRIENINRVREAAAVEGWSTCPIFLCEQTTFFQRTGRWISPSLIACLAISNLFALFSLLTKNKKDSQAPRP